jgi:hypothetical protein
LRHFDPYAGHSWAAGHQAFGAGNNQESSSEAMNFATGMILWGEAVGNEAMRDAGIYIYTTEHQAVEQYWFDVDQKVFPPAYPFETVGILWGHGVAYATWWTANPEEIHGINFLPLTGGSLYLGHRPDYVMRNLNALYAAPGAEGHWHDLLWQYEALADPSAALARWASEPDYIANGGQELGQTAAFTYHWLHAFNAAGQVAPTVTADIPTYAVFSNPATGDLTCVAYNATGVAKTVTFSNGAILQVPPHTLVNTAVGECVETIIPESYPLSVTTAGTGSGLVTSDPAGLSCGKLCIVEFASSSVVTLTAVADDGALFAGWVGDITSNEPIIEVTMDTAKNLTATFNEEEIVPPTHALFLPLINQ